MNNAQPVLQCQSLSKVFNDGKLQVNVFQDLHFSLAQGEQVAIVGASGAGKSTLLHLLGGLDNPTAGKVLLEGVDLAALSERKRCELRNQKMGFVYQLHHLLPEFTVLENTCMPLLLSQMDIEEASEKAVTILKKVGLGSRLEHKLAELSGGERQRAAIARALVASPVCVFADEPTGNLDHKTAMTVYEAMLALNQEIGTSFVIVTHDMTLASRMDRILTLEDGALRD